MPPSQTINLASYYGLVIHAAKKTHKFLQDSGVEDIELRDLVQEGFVRLVEARNRYRYEKGVDFAIFARHHIAGALKDYLRKVDPLSTRDRRKVKELEKAEQEVIQALGRKPTTDELAQALGITEEEVRQREGLKRTIVSLEELPHADASLAESSLWQISSPSPDPEQQTMRKALASDLNHCLETALDAGERRVVVLRVVGDLTLQVVSRVLATSRSTAQRWEVRGLMKLKQCLEKRAWEVTDITAMLT